MKRGQLVVNVPVFVLMFGTMGSFVFLLAKSLIPPYLVFLSIVGSPLVGWIYWSFAITRWRIWAFSQVDNVHELKERAIIGKLIWPDGSIFEKTEIRTEKDRALLRIIETRFDEIPPSREIADDSSIPDTTLIYYSRTYILVTAGFMAIVAGYGVYVLATTSRQYLGIFCVLFGGYYIVRNIKKITSTRPQIILNKIGITIGDRLIKWREINDVTISHSSNGLLILDSVYGSFKIGLADYDISSGDLESRIQVYQHRNKQTNGEAANR
jgi:hypothetical protein